MERSAGQRQQCHKDTLLFALHHFLQLKGILQKKKKSILQITLSEASQKLCNVDRTDIISTVSKMFAASELGAHFDKVLLNSNTLTGSPPETFLTVASPSGISVYSKHLVHALSRILWG